MAQLTDFRAKVFVCLLVVFFLGAFSTQRCSAALYDEWTFTVNNSGIAATVASYLSVDVTDAGGGQVLFTFANDAPGTDGPVVTEIYFEDGALLDLAQILDSEYDPTDYPGVDFHDLSLSPGNPPSINPFSTTAAFSVDTVNPGPQNGIGPGQSLGLLYTLQSGLTYTDVITALDGGFEDPDPTTFFPKNHPQEGQIDHAGTTLRVAVHVSNIGDDGDDSDTFLLTPVPTSVFLGMLGLGAAGIKLRRWA